MHSYVYTKLGICYDCNYVKKVCIYGQLLEDHKIKIITGWIKGFFFSEEILYCYTVFIANKI